MADLGNQLEGVGDGLDRFLESLDSASIKLGNTAAIEATLARQREDFDKKEKAHNKQLKKLEKDKELSEDNLKRALDNVQEDTNEYIERLNNILEAKEKELSL